MTDVEQMPVQLKKTNTEHTSVWNEGHPVLRQHNLLLAAEDSRLMAYF